MPSTTGSGILGLPPEEYPHLSTGKYLQLTEVYAKLCKGTADPEISVEDIARII